MTQPTGLRARMLDGEMLAGTFLKTPHHTVIEILGGTGLDFMCIDAEHSPFDRGTADAMLAVARAQGTPMLVRVPSGSPSDILNVMDMGATGIVVPHVDSVEKAQAVSKASRFGHGGRGYAGSTRWAGYTTSNMPTLLEKSASETIVLAQIEEPEGVDAAMEIAAVDGIDGLFIGPADLTVCYGHTSLDNPDLAAAMKTVGDACRANGKAFVTWVPNPQTAADWAKHGFNVFIVSSEQSWMMAAGSAVAKGIHNLG